MGKAGEEKKAVESDDQGVEFLNSVDVLRNSVRRLMTEYGGVVLSVDCFANTVEVVASADGMKEIGDVMRQLISAVGQVFSDENIAFKITVGDSNVKVEQSDEYAKNFGHQAFTCKMDDKGRFSARKLQFLKEGFPVNVYSKKVNEKFYVVVSNRGDFGLFRHGYDQRCTKLEKHGRVIVGDEINSGTVGSDGRVKIIARGFYAVLVSADGNDSAFASIADYDKNVLPLLEVHR